MATEVRAGVTIHIQQRVHVVPMGFEEDRVVLPAIRLKAERVVLLANTRANDKAGPFRALAVKRLEEAGIHCELVRAPIFDLPRTVDAIVRVFRAYRKESLFINISAGSKIQAVAGLLAAMIVRVEGLPVVVYYCEPETYKDDPPTTPLSKGLRQLFDVPVLAFPSPPPSQRETLALLRSGALAKRDLAVRLARKGFLDKARLNREGDPKDERSRVSLQSSVEQKVIQPLVSQGYVRTERAGRKVMVSLTQAGMDAATILVAGFGDPAGRASADE